MADIIKLDRIAEITEPLALKDSGDIGRFNTARERNLKETRDLALGINNTFLPAFNSMIEPLNAIRVHLDEVVDAGANIKAVVNVHENMPAVLLLAALRDTVSSVAANIKDIQTTAGLRDAVNRVAAIREAIDTVAFNDRAIRTVSADMPSVCEAAKRSADIGTLVANLQELLAIRANIEMLQAVERNLPVVTQSVALADVLRFVADNAEPVLSLGKGMDAVRAVSVELDAIRETAAHSEEIASLAAELPGLISISSSMDDLHEINSNMNALLAAETMITAAGGLAESLTGAFARITHCELRTTKTELTLIEHISTDHSAIPGGNGGGPSYDEEGGYTGPVAVSDNLDDLDKKAGVLFLTSPA